MSVMGKAARRNWKRVVELWQASGLSKVDFCRKNKIPERKFSYYSIKFEAFSDKARAQKTEKTAKPVSSSEKNNSECFAKVICPDSVPASSMSQKSLIMRLDCGASIEIGSDFNPEILRKILKMAASL
jgi:hypothetical protein